MSILKDVSTVNVTMKGEKKMTCNTMSVDWGTIYDGQEQEAEKIIKGLYDTKNYEELHIAQWIWLSLDSERSEAEWFNTFGIPKVRNYCFACEVAQEAYYCLPKWYQEEIADFDEDCPPFCHYCPLADSAEECLGGLCGKWLTTFGEEREELAMEIASLEWKK